MAGFLGKRKKKNVILVVWILLMMICFVGCGKKKTDTTEAATMSKDYVYKIQDVDLGKENQNINQIFRAGELIYAYGYSWLDDGSSRAVIFFELNEDGEMKEEYRIPMEENISIESINMDDSGNIYCIKNDYHIIDPEPGTLEEEIDVEDGGEEEYVYDFYLVKMNLSGEEYFSVKLNDVPDFARLGEENGYFYVSDVVLDKEKGIYVKSYGKFLKFDLEGNYLGIMPQNENPNLFDSATIIALEDGGMAAVLYEDSGIAIADVDLETGKIGEKYELPGASYSYFFYAGKGYDLYLSDSYGVYGYNLGDSDKKQLMSYIDSDLDISGLYQVVGIDGKDFFATYSNETGYNTLAKLSKVPPEEVKEKQVITLAMADTDWFVRRCVIDFNKNNEDYRISILDYNSLYGSDNDYMAGINRMNTDIASGKVPDIILVNYAMPMESYINKGLFEDLKPYIKKDKDLDLDNFMPNIVEAFSMDGKMYSLVPSYSIQTLVAKASDVGEERGWTVQEAMDLLASKPEGTQLIESTTRGMMLHYCMSMSGNQFIDWESGVCNFNSDEFVQMLEFIGTFPEQIDEDIYMGAYSAMCREGKVLGTIYYFGNFRDYNNTEKGMFGEKITMIGFPSSNEDGTVISPNLQFALSSKSANKEGAWEFLRIFLTDEYQKENIIYDFPISIKRLSELAEEAMKKPYYLDENGNKVEYEDIIYIGGEEIPISPMTEQEAEEVMEQLYSFTQVYKQDDTLENIINEEAAPYFAGQKSAKDVAAIIQSRVQIYVNENR
ncbi:MAG: extracellular solute-binding protein [Lachnospiraceae bacterium]|nr:extracellular solute-binding protein [Lachnospiraceae bacterium]